MDMPIYDFFAPANTLDNLLIEENKRLKIKLNAFENKESKIPNLKYKNDKDVNSI